MDDKKKIIKRVNIILLIASIAIVWGGDLVFSLIFERPFYFAEEMSPRLMRTVIAYLPFGFFGIFAGEKLISNQRYKSVKTAYVVGIALAALMWGYAFYDSYDYIANSRTGGANIGLGMVIMASPMFLTGIMFVVYWIMDKFVNVEKVKAKKSKKKSKKKK